MKLILGLKTVAYALKGNSSPFCTKGDGLIHKVSDFVRVIGKLAFSLATSSIAVNNGIGSFSAEDLTTSGTVGLDIIGGDCTCKQGKVTRQGICNQLGQWWKT